MIDLARTRSGLLRSTAIFNLVGDKAKARAQWKARFENRKPPKGPRQAKKVEIRAAAGDTTDILLYDEIGPWGISATDFVTALATITTPNVRVRINSPGGDVFDGMAIYNALLGWKGEVACVVDGIAASAASYIAMAGDTISIHESAMVMIHRAWGFAVGNAADMTDMAGVLAKIDTQIAGIYAKQSGKSTDAMLALMTGESDGTWFTAQEAADAGLVDEVIAPDTEEDPNKTVGAEASSEGVDSDGNDCSCDENDPDYDPDCDCSAENCAKAKALKAAAAEKAKTLMATMRRRLALSDAE